jgi:hypothetical protein
VVALLAAELGITAALIAAFVSEIIIATRRQDITSFLPRTLQRRVPARVLFKGCAIFLGPSLTSYSNQRNSIYGLRLF